MSLSLTLGRKGPVGPAKAWACLTTNLALPGFGSLFAGRVAGYPQAALALAGLGLTFVYGTRFVVWYFTEGAPLRDPGADPVVVLHEVWMRVRWALAGFGLFGVGWVWALVASLTILRESRRPLDPPRGLK